MQASIYDCEISKTYCNINGLNISVADSVRDLEVYVSYDLNWSVPVNEEVRKVNKFLIFSNFVDSAVLRYKLFLTGRI